MLDLLDFVHDLASANSAESAGKQLIEFGQTRSASVVNLFMQTEAGGFRATTIPQAVSDYEHEIPGLQDSYVVNTVQSGVPRVFWGIDLDLENPLMPELDRQIHIGRHRMCYQRSSVTFLMPDTDGKYRGAGVGFGFEDNGEEFRNYMKETCGLFAVAAFATHSRILLLLREKPELSPLTKRQGEILTLLANGCKLGEISERLMISDSAVNLYLSNLKKKLGVKTKEQALALALTNSWIMP